jgi:hypothetical protein
MAAGSDETAAQKSLGFVNIAHVLRKETSNGNRLLKVVSDFRIFICSSSSRRLMEFLTIVGLLCVLPIASLMQSHARKRVVIGKTNNIRL